ncbi:MAG: arylsulfotransferase family protein [bacterium]
MTGIHSIPIIAFAGLLGILACSPPNPEQGGVPHSLSTGEEEIPLEPMEAVPAIDPAVKQQLEAIGYTASAHPAPPQANVTIYDPARAGNGLNLYASWHAPEAMLMDMRGRVLHTWRYAFEEVWPAPESRAEIDHPDFWRRARLLGNGHLLAIYEGYGLIRVDAASRIVWVYPGKCHHDLDVTGEGKIYVLTREAKLLPQIHPSEPVLEDGIAVLDLDGRELAKYSILECFENSNYAPLLRNLPRREGDIFHTNTIRVFDGTLVHRSSLFKKGNVLISILHTDTIAILDLEKRSVLWALSGMWDAQHDPSLLPNGRMLILDNLGNGGQSRVLEFDPFTQAVVWMYTGEPDKPFFTQGCGTCARLPNGNTLITETDFGRAFEVTPDRTIVWEFINPHRAGPNQDQIAKIAEMIRLDSSTSLDWIPR